MDFRGRSDGWRLRSDGPFVVLALLSVALYVYLGRSLTFYYDEWSSISFAGGALDYLRPHNEHWETLPLLLYRATLQAFGMHSYVPYILEVALLHVLAGFAAYVLMRRRIGPVAATIASLPLLFAGGGSENLFWGFQTMFVISVACGLWALVIVEMPRARTTVWAAILLTAAVMSSGMGLFFVVALLARTTFDLALRSRALAVVPPSAVFLAWYLLIGRDVANVAPRAMDAGVLEFGVRGVGHAGASVLGLAGSQFGSWLGGALFAAIVVGIIIGLAQRKNVGLALGSIVGLSSMYLLIGVARSSLDGRDYATTSRYVYVAAFFLVLASADVVRLLPRPRLGRRRRLAIAAGTSAILFAWALGNARETNPIYSYFRDAADLTRMYSYLALRERDAPWVDRDATLDVVPSVDDLAAAVATYGSPIPSRFPSTLSPSRRSRLQNAALLLLAGDRFRVDSSPDPAARPVWISDMRVSSGAAERLGACFRLTAVSGSLSARLPTSGGHVVRLTSSRDSTGSIGLRRDDGPTRFMQLVLEHRQAVDVLVPRIGDDAAVWVVLELPPPNVVRACLLRL